MDSNLFVFFFWQSNGKVEKFFCLPYELEMLRELPILVSPGFDFVLPDRCRELWFVDEHLARVVIGEQHRLFRAVLAPVFVS